MNRKVIYISDFFVSDVIGGAELNDDELIKLLSEDGFIVEKIRSTKVKESFLQERKDCFFIISNFCGLSSNCKEFMIDLDYIIYEHDHKYLKNRNPISYENFKAEPHQIINFFLYKNAKKIICQSKFHKSIIDKNLNLDNTISVGGNLWSTRTLNKISELSITQKSNKCSILESNIANKNTAGTVQYCLSKKIDFQLVKSSNYFHFLELLSKNEKFIFLPRSPETLSRVVVEARMLGCKVLTNQMVGATHEDWFKLKGPELVEYIRNKRTEILLLVKNLINKDYDKIEKPKVSIISTFYKAEKFIEGFMEDITSQTIFHECEFIIVDSASPGKEQEIVQSYCKQYKNIKYIRYDELFPPTKGHNLAMMQCNSKYITWAMIDDRKSEDFLETMYNELCNNKEIDLVYGDCLVTSVENEKLNETKSEKYSEHSVLHFSKENMIKCLPGPMPMWTRRMINNVGFFDDENQNFSDDWELWLRSVSMGSVFKKIDKIVGLYLEGGRSQDSHNIEQKIEEAKLFFKYKDLFGENYKNYYDYFRQFVGLKK
tara:strand:+ start:2745 stop:4376 length:1632 start_codon:yes stop_codon:yes gene_type:complete